MIILKMLKAMFFRRKRIKKLKKDDFITIKCDGKKVSLMPTTEDLTMKRNKDGSVTIFVKPKKERIVK